MELGILHIGVLGWTCECGLSNSTNVDRAIRRSGRIFLECDYCKDSLSAYLSVYMSIRKNVSKRRTNSKVEVLEEK